MPAQIKWLKIVDGKDKTVACIEHVESFSAFTTDI